MQGDISWYKSGKIFPSSIVEFRNCFGKQELALGALEILISSLIVVVVSIKASNKYFMANKSS